MNIKRIIFSVLIGILVMSFGILPTETQAAFNDTTLNTDTRFYLSGVAPTTGGTNGIYIDVAASSTCESVEVGTATLTFSLDSGSSLSLRSSDRKIFSTTVADTSCNSGNSTWTYTSATANESVVITFRDDNNCPAVATGSPSSGGSTYTPPSTEEEEEEVPADESTGEGEGLTTVEAGESGEMGEIGTAGHNALMGEAASATFSLSGATGGAAGTHSVSVQNVTTDQATFTVSSDPVVFTLTTGQSKNVDIDGDNYRDMILTLNRIADDKADVTIEELNVVKIDGAPPGSLVKIASKTAVYYLGEDSQRYVFPHFNVYYSWYDDFEDVITISDEDMAKLPIGGLVTYRPGTWMVTFVTTVDVWAVSQGGVLKKLKDEAMAAELYGENWNQHIHDVNDAFYTSYSFGDDLELAAQYDKETEKGNVPTITVDKDI